MMTKINTKNNVWQKQNKRKRNNTEVWLLCRLKLCYIPSGTWVNITVLVIVMKGGCNGHESTF